VPEFEKYQSSRITLVAGTSDFYGNSATGQEKRLEELFSQQQHSARGTIRPSAFRVEIEPSNLKGFAKGRC
jgi:hypothetical protein